jgi:hypothetical protein
MNPSRKYRLGATPKLFCLYSLRFLMRAAALALLGITSLASVLANAEEPPNPPPAVISPLDNEQDRQQKIRLQEKISRELEENKRRIAEEKKERAKEQPFKPSETSEDTGDPSR